MAEIISLQGSVERVNGKLMLRIPLSQGAGQLAAYTRGIGQIVGKYLEITIPEWLAG
jgi:hypothetical protein